MLILDKNHIYRLDGERIEGFSETIAAAGLTSPFYTEEARERGRRIHEDLEKLDRGEEIVHDPATAGYIKSWQIFKEEMKYEPIEAEYVTHHPLLKVGTTIDRLPGPIDIKTGGKEPWHIMQLALQWDALIAQGMQDIVKLPTDVYLSPDGSRPKIVSYTFVEMKRAMRIYSSLLAFIRWKKENGYG